MRLRRVLGGLLAAVMATAAGACRPSGDGIRTVEIGIRYSRFGPSALVVSPGETVRFVLRNEDPIHHEFILGDLEVQRVHEVGEQPHHARPGEVSVPAGETAVTTYRFGEPGALLFGCHLPGHWSYGMRGTVRVG
ncbi:MAG: cupredoxin domain-containing protein [Actinomycetota bacterium]